MTEAFQPKFVDLVRNYTATQGTGNFVLGTPVNGFVGFQTAIQPGEQFYYSAIGIDRPQEREIGRGRMESNGTISRDPITGSRTLFTSGIKSIALIAAAEWYSRIEAGGAAGGAAGETVVTAHGTAGNGTADDRAALALADAAASGAQTVVTVPAGVYRIASALTLANPVRLLRGARLKPDAGVVVHLAGGYDADDRSHCFDLSAGGRVTGDSAARGYVTPQHFGANPNDASVDDRPAIEAATEFATLQPIRDEYATGIPVKFPQPASGGYYLTRTRPIYVARTTHWFGESRIYLRSYGGVEIRAANGLDAVAVCFFPGGASAPAEYETTPAAGASPTPGIGKAYSGIRSRFSDLTFKPEASAVVRQGFVHNATCFLDRCVASGFTEAGFHAHAQTSGSILNLIAHPGVGNVGHTSTTVPASTVNYDGSGAVWGNVNGSVYFECYAQEGVAAAGRHGGSHGFVAHGNNAGTIKYIGCDGALNKGAGFLENSTIGCELFGCHTASNDFDVSHGGVQYLCIKYHVADAASEPGVGVDWRNYWIANGSVAGDAAWTLGQAYHPAGGVNVCSANSVSSVLAHYTEGGIEVGVFGRNRTTIAGGNATFRSPWHGEFAGCFVSPQGGATNSPLGYTARTSPDDAASDYGASLGYSGGYASGRMIQFGDGRDDATNKTQAMRLAWNATRGRYEWTDASNSSRAVSGWSGSGFTGTGYSGIAQAYSWHNGLYLADGSVTALTVARVRACANVAGLTDAAFGPAVRGDIWLFTNPAAGGPVMARCTTGGTLGSNAVVEHVHAGPRVSVGTTAPPNPAVGDLWVDTN